MATARSKTIKVEIEGFEALRKKLSDPRIADDALFALMKEGAKIGERESLMTIEGGTFQAMHSIHHKAWERRARVYTMMAGKTARSIERGRRPGNVPSHKQIARWITNSLWPGNLTRDEFTSVIRIQNAIKKSGSKGKFYMKAAIAKVTAELPKLQDKVMDKIRKAMRF